MPMSSRTSRIEPEHIVKTIQLTMADVCKGRKRTLGITRTTIDRTKISSCSTCGGQGIRMVRRSMGPMVMQQQAECDVCGGLGKVCGVNATTSKQEVLHLDVYPGCPENAVFVFPGMTNESLKSPTGDLIFKIVYTASKTYKVIENTIDLELRTPIKITLYDSLAGFSRTITHPLGYPITIHSSTTVKPGRYCVEGCGIHLKHTAYDKKGDIYFTLDVEYPTKMDMTQMDLKAILAQESVPVHTISNNEFVTDTTIVAIRAPISHPRPYHNIESFVKHQNEKATSHMRQSGGGGGAGGCTQS